ncbi:MAG: hypothetical protein MK291_10130, partial [Planctomycetes bacterium]|nr:hypothetical protein [Planctomycetota bacterium]
MRQGPFLTIHIKLRGVGADFYRSKLGRRGGHRLHGGMHINLVDTASRPAAVGLPRWEHVPA